VNAIRADGALEPLHQQAALTAAALMGMNNIWYPYVEMAGDPDLQTMRAELRMKRVRQSRRRRSPELRVVRARSVDRRQNASSAYARTTSCCRKTGLTTQQLRDVGRIAAVINAAAQVYRCRGDPRRAPRGLNGARLRRPAPTASPRGPVARPTTPATIGGMTRGSLRPAPAAGIGRCVQSSQRVGLGAQNAGGERSTCGRPSAIARSAGILDAPAESSGHAVAGTGSSPVRDRQMVGVMSDGAAGRNSRISTCT